MPIKTRTGTGPSGKYTLTPGGNGVNGKVVFQKLLPGDTGEITWVLVNSASVPGTLTIASTVGFAENGSNEIEALVTGNNGAGDGDLDEYVGVKIQRGVGADQASASANFTYVLGSSSNYVPMSGLQAALNSESQAMAASGGNNTIVYRLSWSIADPLPVNNNIIQSDTAQIDITFALNQ